MTHIYARVSTKSTQSRHAIHSHSTRETLGGRREEGEGGGKGEGGKGREEKGGRRREKGGRRREKGGGRREEGQEMEYKTG